MKIVYLHQLSITKQIAHSIKNVYPDYDHESMRQSMLATLRQNFYCRKGANSLPFIYDEKFFNTAMPDIDCNYNKSFGEITDQRCLELINTHADRPWLVCWSGGIDSTAVLVSILKNLSPQQRKQVTVSCNKISVYENPIFYHNHVLPNFNVIDSTRQEFGDLLNTHYILDGDPADMLQGSGLALNAKNWGLNLNESWKKSGPLIDYLSTIIDRSSAQWMYNAMSNNLDSLEGDSLNLKSYADWFWWINFNWKWSCNRLHEMQRQPIPNVKPYLDAAIHWYESWDYQQWSMVEGRYSLVKDNVSLGSYKKCSKQYIYEYDKNVYDLQFKTKTDSDSRGPRPKGVSWFCVLDDYRTLTLDRDLDLILELLPTHISSCVT